MFLLYHDLAKDAGRSSPAAVGGCRTKIFAIVQGTFYFIVCSTEFVEDGFKFKTIR